MLIEIHARREIQAPAQAIFDLMLDPARFPATFRGFGPIVAIERITLDGPLQVGTIRRVHQADGVVLSERIDVLEPPHRHVYTLSGFVPPFAWLVREGSADWMLRPVATGTEVIWSYRFAPTAAWLSAPVGLVLRFAMGGAMRRCLAQFARTLEPASMPAGEA